MDCVQQEVVSEAGPEVVSEAVPPIRPEAVADVAPVSPSTSPVGGELAANEAEGQIRVDHQQEQVLDTKHQKLDPDGSEKHGHPKKSKLDLCLRTWEEISGEYSVSAIRI